MQITFLKKLEKNKSIGGEKISGLKDLEIQKIESKLNVNFPSVYKEFLYLAGKDTGGLRLFPGASTIESLLNENFRKFLNNLLDEHKVDLKKPFWAFTEYNDFQHFLFFYLDGNGENPEIYQAELTDVTTFKPLNKTFSQFIDETIDISKSISRKGY